LRDDTGPSCWSAFSGPPYDFDAEATLDPRHVDHHEGDPDGKLIVLVGVEGEDASAWSGSPKRAERPLPTWSRISCATPSAHRRRYAAAQAMALTNTVA
jgi:hypothetical protein